MKQLFSLACAVALVALVAGAVNAAPATSTANVTVSATVSATAKLALGASAISFADKDPDTFPSVLQTESAITISAKAKTSTGSTVTLTVVSGGNLVSGTDNIAITNITWAVTGTGFVAGTLNTTAQPLASWTNSGTWSGTQTYTLANSWAYRTGSYSATLTYTLTAP